MNSLKELGVFKDPVPHQYEFARLNLTYTITSKRKLLQLVEEKHVDGWDDPRMPTISGMRRRGYTAQSIRDFCDRIGIAKRENIIDFSLLEFCLFKFWLYSLLFYLFIFLFICLFIFYFN